MQDSLLLPSEVDLLACLSSTVFDPLKLLHPLCGVVLAQRHHSASSAMSKFGQKRINDVKGIPPIEHHASGFQHPIDVIRWHSLIDLSVQDLVLPSKRRGWSGGVSQCGGPGGQGWTKVGKVDALIPEPPRFFT